MHFVAADFECLRIQDLILPSWILEFIEVSMEACTSLFEYVHYVILFIQFFKASGSMSGVGVVMQDADSYLEGAKLRMPDTFRKQDNPVTFNLYGHNPNTIFMAEMFMLNRQGWLEHGSCENMISHRTDPALLVKIREILSMTLYKNIAQILSSRIITAGTGSNANLLAVQIALQCQRYKSPESGTIKVALSTSAHIELRRQLVALLGRDRVVFFDEVDEIRQYLMSDHHIRVMVLTASTTSWNILELSEEVLEYARENKIWIHLDCALGFIESLLPTQRARDIRRFVSYPAISSATVNLHKLFDLEPAALVVIHGQENIDILDKVYSMKSMYHADPGKINLIGSVGTTSPCPAPLMHAVHKYEEMGKDGLLYLHLCAYLTAKRLAEELLSLGVRSVGEPQSSSIPIGVDSEEDANRIRIALLNPSCLSLCGIQVALIPAEGKRSPGLRIVIPLGVYFKLSTIRKMAACIEQVIKNKECLGITRVNKRQKPIVYFVPIHSLKNYIETQLCQSSGLDVLSEMSPSRRWTSPPPFVKWRIRFLGGTLKKDNPGL